MRRVVIKTASVVVHGLCHEDIDIDMLNQQSDNSGGIPGRKKVRRPLSRILDYHRWSEAREGKVGEEGSMSDFGTHCAESVLSVDPSLSSDRTPT